MATKSRNRIPSVAFVPAGLERETAETLVSVLQERLFGLIDLGLTLKHIHWNVVGPHFIGVHLMLDPQAERVTAFIDETAERITVLGGSPNGLPGRLVAERTWDDYSLGRDLVEAHLGALDQVYIGVVTSHRDAIEQTAEIDPVTQDMLIGQTAELEQFHWFVRAHLENAAGHLTSEGAASEVEAAEAARAALPVS